MPKRQDLRALKNMIAEAKNLIDTSPAMPQGRTARAQELLGDALVLADHLMELSPAVALGKRGGAKTARTMKAKDPDYFKNIAAMRKNRRGGRPRKKPSE